MANFNEQVLQIWNEWEDLTGQNAGNPDDFVAWAMENKKLAPHLQDIKKMLRRQVTTALRQALRVDENGIIYRAKQCAFSGEEGTQIRLWFDTDTGGTPNLRRKAVYQRREAIANDVYRAKSDVDHMNFAYPEDGKIQFILDFTDDYEERKAAEALKRDEDEAA
jgi:hypothetical protein